ncbi:hypothetical protein D3C73_1372730 [compost metagenome]
MGNAGETDRQAAHLLLWYPLGQQATQVGGRQHAVGEHVGHARFAGEIDVDMDRVVITRRAAVQRQDGAVNRLQFEKRDHIANLDIGELRVGGVGERHRHFLSAVRGTSGHRRYARHPGWLPAIP